MVPRRELIVLTDSSQIAEWGRLASVFPNARVRVVTSLDAVPADGGSEELAAIVCAFADAGHSISGLETLTGRNTATPVIIVMDPNDPRICAYVLDAGAHRIFARDDPALIQELRLLLGDDCC